MGKRSNFERRPRDCYDTPPEAVLPLLPFLAPKERFCEPCAGAGMLRDYLVSQGHVCAAAWDIEPRAQNIHELDATSTALIGGISAFITNPPWDRPVLHKIIDNLSSQERTWLLLDADWMHTRQAAPFWPRCSLVISIGRVKWIKESKFTGKDNCCWYRFDPWHVSGPKFIGRDPQLTSAQKLEAA